MTRLIIPTKQDLWVVPAHHDIIKTMICRHQLNAADLSFASAGERQQFTKRLALMAMVDECENHKPSIIAELSQRLVAIHCNENATC